MCCLGHVAVTKTKTYEAELQGYLKSTATFTIIAKVRTCIHRSYSTFIHTKNHSELKNISNTYT